MGKTVYFDCDGNEVEPPKADAVKQTNADRIRAMTDEELADMMEDSVECPLIACPQDDKGANITRRDCRKCWLDWLKEEAKE